MLCRATVLVIACSLLGCSPFESSPASSSQRTEVIAHRGASAYEVDNSLASFQLALDMGADGLETDLVSSSDGVLHCHHDLTLEVATDVEQKFPNRSREDGRWYLFDFTASELATLSLLDEERRVVGTIPTFDALLQLVTGEGASDRVTTDLFLELKQPSLHTEEGLDLPTLVLGQLDASGLNHEASGVVVRSFDDRALRDFVDQGGQSRVLHIINNSSDYDAVVSAQGLEDLMSYADGLGVSKSRLLEDPQLVESAHALGAYVYGYTFRADDVHPDFDSFDAELRHFSDDIGVDAVVTDNPDLALEALR